MGGLVISGLVAFVMAQQPGMVQPFMSPMSPQPPVQDPEMKQFLESRLQTLKQNEAQMKNDLPGNPALQTELGRMQQEIQWLEQSLGAKAETITPPTISPTIPPDFSERSPISEQMIPGPIPRETPNMPGFPGLALGAGPMSPQPFGAGFGAGQVSPQPFGTGLPPQMLEPIRSNLMAELKNVQNMLTIVDSKNDPQFSEHLKNRQADLLKQVQDIDSQLKSPAASPGGLPGAILTPPPPPQGVPVNVSPFLSAPVPMQEKMSPVNPPMSPTAPLSPVLPNPNAEKIRNLEIAVQQLRVAGQQGLADQAQIQIEQLKAAAIPAPVIPQPIPFNPENAAFASPWMTQPSKEIVDLKNTVESLRSEIQELGTAIKALEVQLQILNRNSIHESGRLDQVLAQPPAGPIFPVMPATPAPVTNEQ